MAGNEPYYLLQSAFTAGEISEDVASRTDLDKYKYALTRAENCMIKPHGPVYKRPGLKHCSMTKYNDRKCILVPFNSSDGTDYLLEIGYKYIRVHKDGKYLGVELITPYPEEILPKLRFTQSADTMLIASGDYPVKQLTHGDKWSFEDFQIYEAYFDTSLTSNAVAGMMYNKAGTYTFTAPESGLYRVTVAGAGGGGGGYAGVMRTNKSSNDNSGTRYHKSGYFGNGGNGGNGESIVKEIKLVKGVGYALVVGAGGAKGPDVFVNAGTVSSTHATWPTVDGQDGANGASTSGFGFTAKGGTGGTGGHTGNRGAGNITYTHGTAGTSYGNGSPGGRGGYCTTTQANATSISYFVPAVDGADGYISVEYLGNSAIAPSAKDGEVTLTATSAVFGASDVGSQIKLIHEVPASAAAVTNATSSVIYAGDGWKVISHGTWTGSFEVQKSRDNESWETYRKYTSKNDYNPSESGNVSSGCYLRVACTITSGSCNVDLTAMPYIHEGYAEITGYKSPTSVTALVKRAFGSTEATESFCFASWSKSYGYPKTVCFFQDRLCFGGSNKQPYMLWMSRSGDYNNFGVEKAGGTVTDDSAVAASFVSRKQFEISHLVPSTDLLVMTAGNEWTISGSEVVTPKNINAKLQNTRGCNGCEPLMIGGRIVFVQGRGSTVRDMGYSFETDSYGGNDLTILNKPIVEDVEIVDSAYKQEPDSMLYFVRSDGTMACMAYIIEQEVYAWSRLSTSGRFEAISVLAEGSEDVVYVVVERGGTRRIECFDNVNRSRKPHEHIMLDAAHIMENDEPFDEVVIPELAGRTVNVLGDGREFKGIAVGADGRIILPSSVKRAIVGLPYTMDLELPSVELGNDNGSTQGRNKKVNACLLRLSNSLGGRMGQGDRMDSILYEEFQAVENLQLFSGSKNFDVPVGGYDKEGRVRIVSDEPYPFQLLSIIRVVSFGG